MTLLQWYSNMTSDAEKRLQQKYLQKLPEKLSEIQGFYQQQDRTSFQSAVHKLAGSAGMYGFEELSKISSELEDMIVSDESLKSDKTQTLFEELQKTIKQIIQS